MKQSDFLSHFKKSSHRFCTQSSVLACGLLLASTAQAATVIVNSASELMYPLDESCTLTSAIDLIAHQRTNGYCTATGSFGENDEIIFADELAGQTLTLQESKQFLITNSLKLSGPSLARDDPSKRITLKGNPSYGSPVTEIFFDHHGRSDQPNVVRDINFTNFNAAFLLHSDTAGYFVIERCDFSRNNSAIKQNTLSRQISLVRIEQSSFAENRQSINNGAQVFEINQSRFTGNSSSNTSTVYHYGPSNANVKISQSTFADNLTEGNGAALSVIAGALEIEQSTFSGNSAKGGGGAIFFNGGGSLKIDRSTFENNQAGVYGGAIRASRYAWIIPQLIVTQSTFSNNRISGSGSQHGGGAIASDSLEVLISQSTFDNNQVENGNAGAIWAIAVYASDSTFSNNQVTGTGSYFFNPTNPSGLDQRAGYASAIEAKSILGYNLTLVNNKSPLGNALFVNTDPSYSSYINLFNSLIIDNTGGTDKLCNGYSVYRGWNLTSDGVNNFGWNGAAADASCGGQLPLSVNNPADLGIASLADNGGPTKTHMLSAGSPLIDQATPAYIKVLDIPTSIRNRNATFIIGQQDQRNQPRLVGSAPDLGAVESPTPTPYTHADVTTEAIGGVTLTTINGQLVPSGEDFGKNASVFVFANITGTDNWLLLNPTLGWQLWVNCETTAFPYTTTGSLPWVTDIAVFYRADLSAFHGWPVFFGYGVGGDAATACTNMFNNARYTPVAVL